MILLQDLVSVAVAKAVPGAPQGHRSLILCMDQHACMYSIPLHLALHLAYEKFQLVTASVIGTDFAAGD